MSNPLLVAEFSGPETNSRPWVGTGRGDQGQQGHPLHSKYRPHAIHIPRMSSDIYDDLDSVAIPIPMQPSVGSVSCTASCCVLSSECPVTDKPIPAPNIAHIMAVFRFSGS